MEKHIEKEYKLLVDKESFYKLYEQYQNVPFKTQTNYYYDTVDRSITQSKSAMRIREVNNHFLFTFKKFINNDLVEFECEVTNNSSAVFEDEKISSMLQTYGIQGPFLPLAELRTSRAMYCGNGYELCFDINEYNNTIDYEIEYEYTKPHDGRSNFNHILSSIQQTYTTNCISKIQRALK